MYLKCLYLRICLLYCSLQCKYYYKVRFKLRRVGVEFRIDFLLDEICIVLSRVPILDDVFHCRVPALDVVLRLDKHHRVPGTR